MRERSALELFDDFHRVAGKIASGWASAESMVEAAVWEVIGLEQPLGRVVTRHISFIQQLDILSSLLRRRLSKEFSNAESGWKDLLSRLDDLRLKRNAIVHGNWGGLDEYHESPVIVGLGYEPKNDPVPKAIPFTLREMTEVEVSITRIKYEFLVFVESNFSIHPRPPQVSVQQMVEIGKTSGKKD